MKQLQCSQHSVILLCHIVNLKTVNPLLGKPSSTTYSKCLWPLQLVTSFWSPCTALSLLYMINTCSLSFQPVPPLHCFVTTTDLCDAMSPFSNKQRISQTTLLNRSLPQLDCTSKCWQTTVWGVSLRRFSFNELKPWGWLDCITCDMVLKWSLLISRFVS